MAVWRGAGEPRWAEAPQPNTKPTHSPQQGRDGGRRRGESGEGEGLVWLPHLPLLPEAPRAEAPRAHPWQCRLLPPWTQPSWKRAARRGPYVSLPTSPGLFQAPLTCLSSQLLRPASVCVCVCLCMRACVRACVCPSPSRCLPFSYSVSLLIAASASLCVSPSMCVCPWFVTAHPSVCLHVSTSLPSPALVPSVCVFLSLCLCHSLSLPPFLAPLSDCSLALGPSHIWSVSALSDHLPGRLGCRTRPLPTTAPPPGSRSASGSWNMEHGTWTSPGWCPPAARGQPLGEDPAAHYPEAMRRQPLHGHFGAGPPFTPH